MHDINLNQIKNTPSYRKQTGVSSLLFIVLVGLSLTVMTVGYMSTMRNLQASATTAHAQTQAQMQAMIGYQAFAEFLKDQPLANITKIDRGTITKGSTTINYKKVPAASCAFNQYCFDIIGKSGGATAILRAAFTASDEESVSSHEGSIFAGGLKVQSKETLQALTENVAISVGGNNGEGLEAGNIYLSNGKTIVDYDPDEDNIKVNSFNGGLELIPATDMKKHANYIFTHVGDAIICEKQNLNGVLIKATFECPYYNVTANNGKTSKVNVVTRENIQGTVVWVVDVAKLIEVKQSLGQKMDGILWFDGDVTVKLPNSQNDSSKYFRNTIITTGNLSIEKNATSDSGELNFFSPYDYIVATDITAQILAIDKQVNSGENSEGQTLTTSQIEQLKLDKEDLLPIRLSLIKERLKEVCPVYTASVEYPTGLCKDGFTEQQVNDISTYDEIIANNNKFLKDISKYPTSLFNLIGMADDGFTVHADNNTTTNLFGNLIGSKGAGNTGRASGKFAGTGHIQVIGNLVVAKDMDLTEMKGDVKIKLGQSKSGGNFIPIKGTSFSANGIRYM